MMKRSGFAGAGELMMLLMNGLDQPTVPRTIHAETLVGHRRLALTSWRTAARILSDIAARARVHHQDAFGADRHCDIRAVGNQHIDVALHGQDVDLSVLWALVRNRLVHDSRRIWRSEPSGPRPSGSVYRRTYIPDRLFSRRPVLRSQESTSRSSAIRSARCSAPEGSAAPNAGPCRRSRQTPKRCRFPSSWSRSYST